MALGSSGLYFFPKCSPDIGVVQVSYLEEFSNVYLPNMFLVFIYWLSCEMFWWRYLCRWGCVRMWIHYFPGSLSCCSCTGCPSFTSSSSVRGCWKLRMAFHSTEQAGSMPTALLSPSMLCELQHTSPCWLACYYLYWCGAVHTAIQSSRQPATAIPWWR